LLEIGFYLNDFELPTFVPHSVTPFDAIDALMKIFPTFLNGYRCVIKSFALPFKESIMKKTIDVASKNHQLSSKFSVSLCNDCHGKYYQMPMIKSVTGILNVEENEVKNSSECVNLSKLLSALKEGKLSSSTLKVFIIVISYTISVLLYQRYLS
jgi:hypothetical protein